MYNKTAFSSRLCRISFNVFVQDFYIMSKALFTNDIVCIIKLAKMTDYWRIYNGFISWPKPTRAVAYMRGAIYTKWIPFVYKKHKDSRWSSIMNYF